MINGAELSALEKTSNLAEKWAKKASKEIRKKTVLGRFYALVLLAFSGLLTILCLFISIRIAEELKPPWNMIIPVPVVILILFFLYRLAHQCIKSEK